MNLKPIFNLKIQNLTNKIDEFAKLDKQFKIMANERDKLKDRYIFLATYLYHIGS